MRHVFRPCRGLIICVRIPSAHALGYNMPPLPGLVLLKKHGIDFDARFVFD